MSTAININGVTLIPGKEAAKRAGYSADYIARLAREQKIVGTQIDRQWFIDAESLRHFLESARIEKEARKKKLQAERTEERALQEERQQVEEITSNRASGSRLEAVVASGVVMLLGVLVGTSAFGLYQGVTEGDNLVMIPQMARLPIPSANQNQFVEPPAAETQASESLRPQFTEINGAAAFASSTFGEGVLVLSPGTATATTEKIQALFSDPVDVEFVDERTGRVMVRDDTSNTVYPVVIVPHLE